MCTARACACGGWRDAKCPFLTTCLTLARFVMCTVQPRHGENRSALIHWGACRLNVPAVGVFFNLSSIRPRARPQRARRLRANKVVLASAITVISPRYPEG